MEMEMSETGSNIVVNKEEFIIVKAKMKDENELTFRLKRRYKMRKLMAAYCDENFLDINSLAFMFRGFTIQPQQTPLDLNMDTGDEIDVILVKTKAPTQGSVLPVPSPTRQHVDVSLHGESLRKRARSDDNDVDSIVKLKKKIKEAEKEAQDANEKLKDMESKYNNLKTTLNEEVTGSAVLGEIKGLAKAAWLLKCGRGDEIDIERAISIFEILYEVEDVEAFFKREEEIRKRMETSLNARFYK